MADDEQRDDDDPYGPAVDLVDLGRGELAEHDSDTCAECGADLLDSLGGEGGGGMLCADCDDLTDFTDWEL